MAGSSQLVAKIRRSPILPHDGVGERFAGGAVPQHRGLALIGNADARELVGCDAGVIDCLPAAAQGGLPDLFGVVFHPAVMGKMLGELMLPCTDYLKLGVEYQSAT